MKYMKGRDNPLHRGLLLPKEERSYHGLNLATNPGASLSVVSASGLKNR